VARPQAKNRAGRSRPLSCRTWPHPYVPTSLLENWTARTRTAFLVFYATNAGTNGPQPAAATTKKLRPGRCRPRHKKRAAAGHGSAAGCGPRAPMSCIVALLLLTQLSVDMLLHQAICNSEQFKASSRILSALEPCRIFCSCTLFDRHAQTCIRLLQSYMLNAVDEYEIRYAI
jgi:hypothetical protein